ncbi:flagellar protein FlaG [Photobacterium lipolyticum]|uniref:Flagellar biosynthesis protein FlaG n=1 Tax=Photobacterium lipolyticum TaxID=266810 RepID=A0A2T3N5I8_9GAMM|nr:flagellar protein FlaG [Photobacterium lipolyticum]PSW07605.1 flagellar biosynthesis protein FlaG [Photobacterium lipolyticum]
MDMKPVSTSSQPSPISRNGTNVASISGDSQGLPSVPNTVNPASIDHSSDKGKTDVRRIEQSAELEKRSEVQREQLEKMVEKIEEFVGTLNKGLAFRIDEESGRDVVTIYEKRSGNVVRQIPDEDMLELSRQLASHSGGLVTTKV